MIPGAAHATSHGNAERIEAKQVRESKLGAANISRRAMWASQLQLELSMADCSKHSRGSNHRLKESRSALRWWLICINHGRFNASSRECCALFARISGDTSRSADLLRDHDLGKRSVGPPARQARASVWLKEECAEHHWGLPLTKLAASTAGQNLRVGGETGSRPIGEGRQLARTRFERNS